MSRAYLELQPCMLFSRVSLSAQLEELWKRMHSTLEGESYSFTFILKPWSFQRFHIFMQAAQLIFIWFLKLSLELLKSIPRYLKFKDKPTSFASRRRLSRSFCISKSGWKSSKKSRSVETKEGIVRLLIMCFSSLSTNPRVGSMLSHNIVEQYFYFLQIIFLAYT